MNKPHDFRVCSCRSCCRWREYKRWVGENCAKGGGCVMLQLPVVQVSPEAIRLFKDCAGSLNICGKNISHPEDMSPWQENAVRAMEDGE